MPSAESRLDPADDRQLGGVVAVLVAELGDALVGMYLHGSAVLSSLRPSSDLDLLVVTRQPPDVAQQHRLIRSLLLLSGSAVGVRPLEVTVVERADPAAIVFQYGEWNRADYEAGVITAPSDDDDIVVVLAGARAANIALSGPPLADLVPAVDDATLRAAVLDVVPNLLIEAETDTRNVILTLARIAYTLGTGSIAAKDVAGRWVADRITSPVTARVLVDAAAHYTSCGYDEAFDVSDEQRGVTIDDLRVLIHQLSAGVPGQAVSSGSVGNGGGSVG